LFALILIILILLFALILTNDLKILTSPAGLPCP
jgi:hypothetical protein